LKKNHETKVEDPKLVPFNVPVAYAVCGGSPHERYMKVSTRL
jgi:hypothetical protein